MLTAERKREREKERDRERKRERERDDGQLWSAMSKNIYFPLTTLRRGGMKTERKTEGRINRQKIVHRHREIVKMEANAGEWFI